MLLINTLASNQLLVESESPEMPAIQLAYRRSKRAQKKGSPRAKNSCKQLDLEGNLIKHWPTAPEAARGLELQGHQVKIASIYQAAGSSRGQSYRKSNIYAGFRWELAPLGDEELEERMDANDSIN